MRSARVDFEHLEVELGTAQHRIPRIVGARAPARRLTRPGVVTSMLVRFTTTALLGSTLAWVLPPARADGALQAVPAPAPVVERHRALLSELDGLRRKCGVPGASFALLEHGEIVIAEGLGVRRVGGNVAVDRETLFQAGSISKPVAALAALRMVAAGDLALDRDVNEQLDSFELPDSPLRNGKPTTLRALLSHTAGLSVHGFSGYLDGQKVPELLDILEGVAPANSPPIVLELEPGTKWQYSGGGYTVMQQLLIDVSGEEFPKLLQEQVIVPLGMTRSSYEQPLPPPRRANVAAGHTFPPKPLPGDATTLPELAAAGLWTTPSDLLRFGRAMQRAYADREGAILPQPLAKEALTPMLDGDYGLGFQLFKDADVPAFGHGGSNQGFHATLFLLRDSEDGFALMTNGDNGPAMFGPARELVIATQGWKK